MFSPTCWIKGQEKAKPHRGPAVGEHSAEVLREAGYSEAEIHGLREEGGIGSVRAWGLTVERVGNQEVPVALEPHRASRCYSRRS
jgi:hypothetical protein